MRFSRSVALLNLGLAVLFSIFSWLQRNNIAPALYAQPSVIDAALWLLFYLLIAVLLIAVLLVVSHFRSAALTSPLWLAWPKWEGPGRVSPRRSLATNPSR